MGKKPDEIEREIRERRQAISSRVEGLQGRVQKDIETVKEEATSRVSGSMDEAKRAVDIDSKVQEHPMTTLAGAFGVGVLLGVASESITGRDGDSNGYADQRRDLRRESGSGLGSSIGDMVASVLNPVALTFRDELKQLVRDGISTVRSNINDNGGPPSQAVRPSYDVRRDDL